MSYPPDGGDADGLVLARIADGDADALGALYERYTRVLFGVVHRMTGRPDAAEEVIQDAFHSVWRQARSYSAQRGTVRTWLFAICRNAAIDWRRTRGRRIERETMMEEAAATAGEALVDDRVMARLRAERVRSVVASLPTEQREAIALAFWAGLSQREISERTGTPLGTVKSRIRLATAKLRERLVGEERE